MTDLAPHELSIWEMAGWSEADADAAVARYEQAGPEAIEWLERQVGQRLDGAEGLTEAWRWIVAALLADAPVDVAMLTFAIAHLYACEVRRREPRFVWERYDDPLKAKLLGYNAPALCIGAFKEIPALLCANMMGRVERYKAGELNPSYEHALEATMLNGHIDRLLSNLEQRENPAASVPAPNRIVRVPDDEVDGAEGWERMTDQPELRNVEAIREDTNWQVHVWVAEYVREEPLESQLRDRMTTALQAVSGVTLVVQEDREVWSVDGTPAGDVLLQAAADVVDDLADRAAVLVYGETS